MKANKTAMMLALAASLALPLMSQTSAATTSDTQSSARHNIGGVYDQQIQQDVAKYLRDSNKLKNVSATVDDGIVNLSGSVDLLKYKLDAEKKIRNRDHVAGVRNQIAVAGKTVPDIQLRDSLAKTLSYDRENLGSVFNNLNIAVKDGVATVIGNVRNDADKSSALAEIANTPGVKGLVDQLKVAPVSGFDDQLRAVLVRKIYGRLPMYANDPQAPIRIVVENGRVGLFGVVDSKVDKQIAEAQARTTPGVFSVTNNLAVANGKQG